MSSSSVQVPRPPSGTGTGKDLAPTGAPGSLGFDVVRCSRCQCTMSLDSGATPAGVVRFGMNSYYCGRCANRVGYTG
ncbi:hypothetical protein BDW74DRAFT_176269 [Aspergillus multicolor]|uniref:uncharacterized protein n=1 Tax=Aspergillus multicolor TaxID=41759 RepID=UPI003CCCB4DB